MVGGENAVADGQTAATGNPCYKATVVGGIAAFETAVELTVADDDIGAALACYEASEKSLAMNRTVERDRRAAVLNADCGPFHGPTDETCCISCAGIDGSCRAQVLDSSIAYIAERCLLFGIVRDADGQRVSVTIEHTAERAVSIARTVAGADVGIEAGVHRLPLGVCHLLTESVPIIGVADGEEVFCHILQLVDG